MAKHRLLTLVLLAWWPHVGMAAEGGVVEFNRDIRPILSDNCFSCHGPDDHLRKAGLRLDRDDGLTGERGAFLVPGDAAASELFQRVVRDGPGKMPPARTNKSLTSQQVEKLRSWIEQGARYQGHWAFLPPHRTGLPHVKNTTWTRNSIDHFILTRLEDAGLSPAPEADRRTLIRRLSFDLLGLPPTPAEVDAFLADGRRGAYEQVVDRLLASPHFGERMAMVWLDLVRYADSEGYFTDLNRDVYLYRDWVIRAFNENMPFDEFTAQQLAGDLLPQATARSKIASGYNRLLQTTREGGAQLKEYRAKYYADRVRNFSTVWLGLTIGCCECHDHKFDPISTKEFYQLEAFFADLQENPLEVKDYTTFRLFGLDDPADMKDALAELDEKRDARARTPPEYCRVCERTRGFAVCMERHRARRARSVCSAHHLYPGHAGTGDQDRTGAIRS